MEALTDLSEINYQQAKKYSNHDAAKPLIEDWKVAVISDFARASRNAVTAPLDSTTVKKAPFATKPLCDKETIPAATGITKSPDQGAVEQTNNRE